MRALSCTIALATLTTLTPIAAAQRLELPLPSPIARVTQNVGLTEITVDYSSPAVKGRKIWGGLVPYGEVWRAGANSPTKISFSKDVSIGNTAIAAGSYGLLAIPNKNAWTFILTRKPDRSAFEYKPDADAVRVDVKAVAVSMRERLQYSFGDFADQNHVALELEWEKVRVALPIKLATAEQVEGSLKGYEENMWSPLNQAARYQLDQTKNISAGLSLVDKSIAIRETWFNTWTKAQLLAAKGDYKTAHTMAVKADELGQKAGPDRYFFKDDVQKAINEWKSK
jgi:hypothetical protein